MVLQEGIQAWRGLVGLLEETWENGFAVSEHLGLCSAVKAEVRAVLQGLQLAKEAGTHKLWVQIDSQAVVSMLTTRRPCHPEYTGLVQQCKQHLNWEGWEVKISHCFRETNQVADRLANMGIEDSLGVKTYHAPPMETGELLYADGMGVSWPRRLNLK